MINLSACHTHRHLINKYLPSHFLPVKQIIYLVWPNMYPGPGGPGIYDMWRHFGPTMEMPSLTMALFLSAYGQVRVLK